VERRKYWKTGRIRPRQPGSREERQVLGKERSPKIKKKSEGEGETVLSKKVPIIKSLGKKKGGKAQTLQERE